MDILEPTTDLSAEKCDEGAFFRKAAMDGCVSESQRAERRQQDVADCKLVFKSDHLH